MAQNAQKVSDEEWTVHREEIISLYRENTLAHVMQLMNEKYGLHASEYQFTKRLKAWGVRKNAKTDTWEFVDRRFRKRELEGKESDLLLNGKHYSSKKAKGEIARHVTFTSACFNSKAPDPPTPEGVLIFTPKQTPRLLCPTRDIRIDNLPWSLFKRAVQSQLISPQSVLTAQNDFPSLEIVPAFGQPFSPFDQLLTDIQSTGTFNEAPYLYDDLLLDSINMASPVLPDWALGGDIAFSSAFDTMNTLVFPEVNQAEPVMTSLSLPTVSHEIALSFLSELSHEYQEPGSNDIGEFVSSLRRYTVEDDDLEIGISSDTSTTIDVFATKIFPAAVQAGEIELIRKLISRGIDVNVPVRGKTYTALSFAVERRDIKVIELLCTSGARPEVFSSAVIRDIHHHDSLWSHRNIEILTLLLKFGANPEMFVSNEPRGFPLISAASLGEVEAVSLLLNAKARTDLGISNFGTALQAAAARGHEAVVRVLIEAGADVNATQIFWNDFPPDLSVLSQKNYAALKTPIQLAAIGNHMEIVQILLQSGALVNICPVVARLGLQTMDRIFSHWEEKRMERNCNEEVPVAFAIQYATLNQNIALVQQLLAAGANVDSRVGTNYGDTPLQTAARLGDMLMTRLLLTHKANVNVPPGKYNGRTAIQAAAENGNIEIIQLLLDVNADVNAAAGWGSGRTAFKAAIENRHIWAARLLLRAGADINAKPAFSGGLTALQAAAKAGDLEILKEILGNGADVNASVGPEDGLTALQAVIRHKNISALDMLLQAGADVNGRPSKWTNKTALQHAVCLEWAEGVRCLLDAGSDINAFPPQASLAAFSALGWSIQNQDHDMIQLLLSYGADPNAPALNDEGAPSAFLYALFLGCSFETIDLFFQKHADLTQTWCTKSALEVAVSRCEIIVVEKIIDLMSQIPGDQYLNAIKRALACIEVETDYPPSIDLIRTLLQAGADINTVDDTGQTLLQMSVLAPDVDVIKFLLENGAEVNVPATRETGTPLQAAILYENVQIADLLIDHGADINALPAAEKGATALQAAAIHGYHGLALRLLKNGADVAAAPSPISGRTAIDGAAEHGHLDMIQLLLNAYGDREDLPLVCSQAASAAEREGHPDIAKWLRGYASS